MSFISLPNSTISLIQPLVGGDINVWGTELNSNASTLQSTLNNSQTRRFIADIDFDGYATKNQTYTSLNPQASQPSGANIIWIKTDRSLNYIDSLGANSVIAGPSGLGLGVVHSNAFGVFSSSLVVNADYSSAPGDRLSGTKLNLDGYLVDSNIASGANINISKFAKGTSDGYTRFIGSLNGANSFSQVDNTGVSSTANIAQTKIAKASGSNVVWLSDVTAGNTFGKVTSAYVDSSIALTTTTITAGAGLTGGGSLASNRQLDVVAADSTITVNADSIQVGTITDSNVSSSPNARISGIKLNLDGYITDANVSNSANIQGTKITANFGNQNITTTNGGSGATISGSGFFFGSTGNPGVYDSGGSTDISGNTTVRLTTVSKIPLATWTNTAHTMQLNSITYTVDNNITGFNMSLAKLGVGVDNGTDWNFKAGQATGNGNGGNVSFFFGQKNGSGVDGYARFLSPDGLTQYGSVSETAATWGTNTQNYVNTFNGSVVYPSIISTSSNYTIDGSTTKDFTILTDSTSGAVTITLPAHLKGRSVIVKDKAGNAQTNNITIARAGGTGTIDGTSGSYVIQEDYQSITLISDGASNWAILSTREQKHITRRKTADQSVTSSTTLVDESALQFPIGASERWVIEWVLIVTYANAGGVSVAVVTPTSATQQIVATSVTNTSGETLMKDTQTSGGTLNMQFGSTSTRTQLRVVATVNSSNAGTVKLQFAQGASNGTATTVLAQSYMVAHQVL